MHCVNGPVLRATAALSAGSVRRTALRGPVGVVMGLHKLTAGDGYTYLTRQVAAHDATEKGHNSLGEYYAEHGESPGQWLGSGLTGLHLRPQSEVSAEQMKALFGHGRHPNATALEAAAAAAGADARTVAATGALGRRFPVYEGASVFNTAVARAFSTHNRDRGQPWNTPIPAEVRAEIRTTVARRMFAEEQGRPPADARELSGFVARASRSATSAVAGYDLTFSPVKSVSTLWALAPRPVAEQVRAAHQAAVAETLRWLETEATFTRVGRAGARQVATRGLIAASFTHRDTRAGDPDLHTHVAISNKVQTLEPVDGDAHGDEGRWLALDGRLLYQANVAASERYNTRLEAELTDRLGLQFADSPTTFAGARPVREIVGVNTLLTRWWSRRRRDIEARRAILAADFQDRHGRPPTAVEAIALAQQATLETRAAKHAPTREHDQRATWRREAEEVLGGPLEVDDMLHRTLSPAAVARAADAPPPAGTAAAWIRAAAATSISAVEASRATWQIWHLQAEAQRQARAAGIRLADLDRAVDQVIEQALELSVRLGAPDPVEEPPSLRRSNGESVYEVHGSTRFTSARILAAEEQILDAARTHGGRALTEVRVGIAVAEAAANGVELNDAQAAMVRDLATSGALLQLALAPAGTGKTTAMRTLARAWADSGGHTVGLAPSAQAAHELYQALHHTTRALATGGTGSGTATAGRAHTDTLTKLTWTLTHAPTDQWPTWIHDIGPRTLVIIDEAGQAGTVELAEAVTFITGRGGIVRLIGDDQQLAAVAAGGVLRDLHHTNGAATLSEVRRFIDPAEAAVTLAVREGDATALGFYADHGRLHVGDIGAATDQAYTAWAYDRDAGLDSLLLAPTRDLVTQLNARARTDRLRTQTELSVDPSPEPSPGLGPGLASADAPEVRLGDSNRASVGDVIVTKRNDRHLVVSSTDWVKNGDRWTITAVHDDHAITARHRNSRRTVRLPAAYVSEHVRLGYATTVHAAQGMTVDTAHTVVACDENRQLLYVALSRGRRANHLYLASGHNGDPHSLIRPETLQPRTALDILTRILEHDGTQHSATTTRRDLESPAAQLHQAVLRYHDALGYAAEQALAMSGRAALDAQIETIWPGLTSEPAYPTLRTHLALRALNGHAPLTVLLEAASAQPVDPSVDRAAVLDQRLNAAAESTTDGPLPWLESPPTDAAISQEWRTYLSARADRVRYLAKLVHQDASHWSPAQAPPWACDLTSPANAALRGDVAVWRAAFGIDDSDLRPTGAHLPAGTAAQHRRHLNRRLRPATHQLRDAQDSKLLQMLPDEVTSGPGHGVLAQRLQALRHAGADVAHLLRRVLEEPRPLPRDCAAAALWWRVTQHLGPAALRASGIQPSTLRPAWAPALAARIGEGAAERVMADTAWPALVAAIHARPPDWTAEQLIDSITAPGQSAQGTGVGPEELCTALIWRIATMTDPPPEEPEEPDDPAEVMPPAAAPSSMPVRASSQTHPSRSLGITRDRIIELNHQALDFYTGIYARSWAPAYLTERIGTDLTDDPRFAIGYAPPGPTSLIRRLTSQDVTVTELLQAGLTRRTNDGRIVDAFRDRVVFPTYSGPDLVGFIARRNPTKEHSPYAGPKYLNTRSTPAFTKSTLLYGLTEATAALEGGAVPVLVEGPLDAIACTLYGHGTAGVAPLGTAFTDSQASQLAAFIRRTPARILVATDADPAGWTAAQKAFWRLAALGANPQHVTLPVGHDPADLINLRNERTLPRVLEDRHPLADTILDEMLASTDLHETAARLWLARDTAKVIAALPPTQWSSRINQLTDRLALPRGMLHMEVIEAAETWDLDPQSVARHQIRKLAHAPSVEQEPPAPRMPPPRALSLVDLHGKNEEHQRREHAHRPRPTLRP